MTDEVTRLPAGMTAVMVTGVCCSHSDKLTATATVWDRADIVEGFVRSDMRWLLLVKVSPLPAAVV